jgi:hypothetical protein
VALGFAPGGLCVSKVRVAVTFREALAGRWTQLVALGVGGLGVGELFARRMAVALACLVVAAVLCRGSRSWSW